MRNYLDLYELLSEDDLPTHWPPTSLYRLRSVKTRVLKRCRGSNIPFNDVLKQIKKITNDSFSKDTHTTRTLKTYQSVLIRFVAEKIKGHSLQPWEALSFLKNKNQ